ncbi:MAG: enoyl-CoA hydratase-related protein [Pseudomonadota bacterium]
MSDLIEFTVEDGVARIVLNRQSAFNAFDQPLASALRDALEQLRARSDARCLVVTGAGKAFCAGGDVVGFNAAGDAAPSAIRSIVLHLHAAVNHLLALEMPVIAAINGPTAGAGMGLFMGADLAIASDKANFTMAYTAIGASPDGSSTFFLPRLVGLRRAMELTLTNRRLSAEEALDWGLVNEVVPADELDAVVAKRAAALAAGPTKAFATARRLLADSFQTAAQAQMEREIEGIAAMGATDDFREGCAAFVERRRAEFKGS